MPALGTPLDAVRLMKIVWLQIVMRMMTIATAVQTATCMKIVAAILSTFAHPVND